MNTIYFYKVSEPYGEFSNFAAFRTFINGENWPTVEHYFQANKFTNESVRRKIQINNSPMAAANEGRSSYNVIREDWEEIKESVMLNGLTNKFFQHPQLRKLLLNTGNAQLVEHTSNDNYWGDGGDGSGKNRLGILLMQVRDFLNKISPDPKLILPPWLAFPQIDKDDMFWGMGIGESYMSIWAHYYVKLSDTNLYKVSFPEPVNWGGFYE